MLVMQNELKPIIVRDKRALLLIHERAKKENRSLANTTVTTVIEALGKTNVLQVDGNKKKAVNQ